MRLPVAVGLCSIMLTMATRAAAEQFVLVDADYAHTKESHAYAKPAAGIPTNWKTPVNYAEGTAHYRLVVLEKPSAENLNMGVCFVGSSYCCYGYARFTKPGVYEWTDSIPNMWQYSAVDFTKPMTEIPFIMRDRNAVKVDPGVENFYGAPSTALYFTMKSHLTITIVSKGGTFVKPDAGPGDVGAPDAPRDVAAEVASDTAVVAEDTMTAPPMDAAAATDAAMDDAATGEQDAAAEAPNGEALDGASCATYVGRAPAAPLGLLVIGLASLAARRRRTG